MRFYLFLLLLILTFDNLPAFGQASWATAPANLTTAEFLGLHFHTRMARGETGSALNDFNLVNFFSSDSPDSAFVLLTQTWHDERVTQANLRREIRVVGDVIYNQFKAEVNHPTVRKRWHPSQLESSFFIKHVRYSDVHEVLGVTIGGTTYFDQDAIKRAELSVRARGGVGAW